MGTNYYLQPPTCKCCKHTPEPLHIGKSSVGWNFQLRVYPEQGINSLIDWDNYIKDHPNLHIIEGDDGEFNRDFLVFKILHRIPAKYAVRLTELELIENSAEYSLKGLLRNINRIPDEVKYFEVTYDLIPYEFS